MDGNIRRVFSTGSHGFHGYSVKFSPFSSSLLAVVASENFGIKGRGQLLVYNINEADDRTLVNSVICPESIYDLTWSEVLASCIVTASGNGQVQMWNKDNLTAPVKVFSEHMKEASCVEWVQTREAPNFLSTSWDGSVKVWDPNFDKSIATMCIDNFIVYAASWSPKIPSCIASVSANGTLKVWNTKNPQTPTMCINVAPNELLTVDWNKYNLNQLCVGATDGKIYIWDLRNIQTPFFVYQAHTHAVKRTKYSPFRESELASSSYDFTTRIWDYHEGTKCLQSFTSHTEFVYGLDYSTHLEGLVVDCSWDCTIKLYDIYNSPS